jgi:hypothetical protein
MIFFDVKTEKLNIFLLSAGWNILPGAGRYGGPWGDIDAFFMQNDRNQANHRAVTVQNSSIQDKTLSKVSFHTGVFRK